MISRTEGGASWDFERSSEYVREQGLQDHISFASAIDRDKALPLNSDRQIYEIANIVVGNLDIELDDGAAWNGVEDWNPVSHTKWHFEGCRFRCQSTIMWTMAFPWRGSFRFDNNEFSFAPSQYPGHWGFVFEIGSSAWFVGNDFLGNNVQTRCVNAAEGQDDSSNVPKTAAWKSDIAFVANKGIHELGIFEGYSRIEISGMNRIDRLAANLMADVDRASGTSIYFGPREKIDPLFHNCIHHRSLFLAMRRLAATREDSRQLTVLDRQLERIEYFLNKGQDTPSLLDCRVWIEYWQDRVLYAWRRWSSDFYRSWLRPLAMLVAGYLTINALPFVLVEPFSVSDWFDLSLRPIGEIATYEVSVGRIVGGDYETVRSSGKTLLKLAGLVEVVWIGIWGFVFAKSVRR